MSEEQVAAVIEEEEKTPEQEKAAELPTMLKGLEGAPSTEQIETWKAQHGDVFVSGFSEQELFVWRTITRPEFVQLQQAAADPQAGIDQFRFEELVCNTCTLWKSVKTDWNTGKAGTPATLHEQIMQNSNFMPPQMASMLVAKL